MPPPLGEDLIESLAAFLRGMRLWVATCCGCIVLTATTLAQTAISERIRAGRFSSALRIAQGPSIDGSLDDECWQRAIPITNFTQVLPVEGAAPSERTEVRFAYTRDMLFIAIRCFDRAPGKILAKSMQRDNAFDSDDYVKIAFDTFGRQRDGYVFMVNPAGARTDGIFGKFSGENTDFDALWTARARIASDGWLAEIEIPFKSISFDPRHDFWRMNLERVIRHKQETVRWTAISRTKSVTALEDFGDLRDLRELRQGLGLEFRPYVLGRYRHDPFGGRSGFGTNAGFDVTYRITPSLTVVGTTHTDSSEADVDERIISLSRFPTFFPEKRDFFLQDASIFSFGGLTTERPYFSRRIGLTTVNQPIEILGGVRLTGRVGATSVALLDVQQQGYAGIDSKNLGILRISQQALEESSVGMILTNGDPATNGDATLAGLDFNYQNSHLSGDNRLIGHAYVMGSHSEAAGGDDLAFGADLDYPNEPLEVRLFFRQWGEIFDMPLGFLARRNIRRYSAFAAYTWRPNTEWIRRISLSAGPLFGTDLDNRLVEENHSVPYLFIETPALDGMGAGYALIRDVVDEAFEIVPRVVLPPGNYSYGFFEGYIATSAARPLGAVISLNLGDYYSGTKSDYRGELNWRPSRFFTATAAYELRNLRLAEGDFDVRIASAVIKVAFTPDLTWNTVVQYDNISKQVGLNSRIRWTWRTGDDLFFVVNQGWDYDRGRFRRPSSEIVLKVAATFRF
jgi:hypothetical protein